MNCLCVLFLVVILLLVLVVLAIKIQKDYLVKVVCFLNPVSLGFLFNSSMDFEQTAVFSNNSTFTSHYIDILCENVFLLMFLVQKCFD